MKTVELVKLLSLFLGANGIWKLVEFFFRVKVEKRKHTEEINNLKAQTSNLMLENWIEWSTRLENRVRELESKLTVMSQEVEKKQELLRIKDQQVDELTGQLNLLKTENQTLKIKLSQYE